MNQIKTILALSVILGFLTCQQTEKKRRYDSNRWISCLAKPIAFSYTNTDSHIQWNKFGNSIGIKLSNDNSHSNYIKFYSNQLQCKSSVTYWNYSKYYNWRNFRNSNRFYINKNCLHNHSNKCFFKCNIFLVFIDWGFWSIQLQLSRNLGRMHEFYCLYLHQCSNLLQHTFCMPSNNFLFT